MYICSRNIGIWIGCNDIAHEGRFVWFQNHRRITFSNWAPGEPNNAGNEDCCMMIYPTSYHRAGQWNDAPCGHLFENFICKKKVFSFLKFLFMGMYACYSITTAIWWNNTVELNHVYVLNMHMKYRKII